MVKKKMTIDDLAVMTQKEFVTVHKKFAAVNKKLGEHDKQFDKIDSRLDGIDSRLDGLDTKVDNVQELNMRVLAALDENTTILRDTQTSYYKIGLNNHEKWQPACFSDEKILNVPMDTLAVFSPSKTAHVAHFSLILNPVL